MPTPALVASAAQRALFDALSRCGELILAIGPEGVSANLVGTFAIRRRGLEDVLEVDDGRHHVHVDWRRVQRVSVGSLAGEGLLALYDGMERLLGLYRPRGPFPTSVTVFADVALWPSAAGDP